MVGLKILLVAIVASVAAHPQHTPAPQLDKKAIDCSKFSGALSVLKKLGPPATTFCSSYLKVAATKTSLTTITPVTTITTSTSTIIVTSSVCPAPSQPKRSVLRRDHSLELAQPRDDAEKRTNVLALFAVFAAAKVSAGCSCLSIMPKATTTVTRTAAASTSNVVATVTSCTTVCAAKNERCSLNEPGKCCAQICFSLGDSSGGGTCG